MNKPQECPYNKDDPRDFRICEEFPVVTEYRGDCPYCDEENVLMYGEYEGKAWVEHCCEHLETFRYDPFKDKVQAMFSKKGAETIACA